MKTAWNGEFYDDQNTWILKILADGMPYIQHRIEWNIKRNGRRCYIIFQKEIYSPIYHWKIQPNNELVLKPNMEEWNTWAGNLRQLLQNSYHLLQYQHSSNNHESTKQATIRSTPKINQRCQGIWQNKHLICKTTKKLEIKG